MKKIVLAITIASTLILAGCGLSRRSDNNYWGQTSPQIGNILND